MMKNKTNVKWKKWAATIVMSLCLLMGLMPIKVFAAGSPEYSEDIPVYSIESATDTGYVLRPGVTATFTSDTEFTLGASDEYNNSARIDYYNYNRDDSVVRPDEGFDILVECNIQLRLTEPTSGSISGEITIPLPSGCDGAAIKDSYPAISSISYNETTVTFPVTLEVSSGSTSVYALVEYKEKPQHTHSYGDWQKDETNHWHKCACGEKADSAAHSYDNDADTTCNDCGYVRTVTASTPSITKGQNEKWTPGSANELIFTSNAPLSEFISVTIDGQVVDEKNYVKEEGSTIIKLKADYLSTLSAGNHTISINSTSGSATAAFTIEETVKTSSPKTVDNNSLFLWTTILCMSGLAIFGTHIYSKKKKNIQ